MKFSEIKSKIKNNPGFNSLKEIKQAGYRIVKERDGDRYFLVKPEKLKPILVRLGDIAEVRRGFTTGCNEFFYLPSKHFDIKPVLDPDLSAYNAQAGRGKEGRPACRDGRGAGRFYKLIPKHEGLPEDLKIEEEYLPASILSPRDADSLIINISRLPKRLLLLSSNGKISEGVKLYIEWGTRIKFNKRPTCKTREKWWSLAGRMPCQLACNYLVNDYMRFYTSKSGLWVSDNFQEITVSEKPIFMTVMLNSIITQLFVNMVGRSSFGGGLLKVQTYEVADLPTLLPSIANVKESQVMEIMSRFSTKCNKPIYEQCGINPKQPIRSQKPNPLPDRKALDDIVFDILGLTEAERHEVYWAVAELVANRLQKAKSL